MVHYYFSCVCGKVCFNKPKHDFERCEGSFHQIRGSRHEWLTYVVRNEKTYLLKDGLLIEWFNNETVNHCFGLDYKKCNEIKSPQNMLLELISEPL